MNSEYPSSDDPTVIVSIPTINALPVGTVLDEFEIIGMLGEGGFGIVYRSYDHSLEREVALKEYMPLGYAVRVSGTTVVKSGQHFDTFEAGLRSFISEAKFLAKFDHPSLVKVYRFFEANGTAYMAMPLYNGSTLKEVLNQRTEPPDERWLKFILKHLLDALKVIHQEDCYHRDISPDNIIILKDNTPLLLDFGAARRVIQDISHIPTAIYKAGYAPIEQCGESEMKSTKQGAWTDIYALSAVAYFAITGRKPPSAVSRALTDNLELLASIESLKSNYSQSVLKAIDKGLAFRPEDRPQDVNAFRELLCLTEASTVEPEFLTLLQVDEKDKKHFPFLKVFGFIIFLGVFVGIWFFAQDPPTDNANIIKNNFKAAEDCLNDSRYECAIAKVETILDLDPENKKAVLLLAHVKQSKRAMNKDLEEARICLENSDYECAIEKAEMVLGFDTNNMHAKIIRNDAIKSNDEISIYLKDAKDCLGIAQFDCVQAKVEAILNIQSSNKQAISIQNEVMQKLEKINTNLKEAEECFKKAKFNCVITKTNLVLSLDPHNSQAKNLFNKTNSGRQQSLTINKNLNDAKVCLDKAKYECAITKADLVLSFEPNNGQAQTILNTAKTKQKEAWHQSPIE